MKTLIVYSPGAQSDVEKWMKRKGIEEKFRDVMFFDGSTGKYSFDPKEQILIMKKFALNKDLYCNKLVLLGQFGEIDLSKINRYINFI